MIVYIRRERKEKRKKKGEREREREREKKQAAEENKKTYQLANKLFYFKLVFSVLPCAAPVSPF